MTALYVEIHALHTLPPSNINRDDTGSPKSAMYGGVRRARVSSQAWKRAIRTHFNATIDPADRSYRTTHLVEKIAGYITDINPELNEKAGDYAKKALAALGLKTAKPKGGEEQDFEVTGYLVFMSAHQLRAIAENVVASIQDDGSLALDKKSLLALTKGKHSVDIALFGRMVADVPDMNLDASAQVAHALGVSRLDTEFDFFTAVDDAKAEQSDADKGAGMIGTVEFASTTFYRYATVNVTSLTQSLGEPEAAKAAVLQFVDSFVKSMPTGKQNTFANRTLPDGLVITLRTDQPASYVGAFEEPLTPLPGEALSTHAARTLVEYASSLSEAYGTTPEVTLTQGVGTVGETLSSLGAKHSLPDLLSTLDQELSHRLAIQG
ncbi:type I-E CRISPR-associated protein Cas7/Cse4/CasC [Jonesia quinghaiensis]|uniref:type I-E CRISPR-associated protein Cas7/Cse4/CasC n=1 Tax=Jonesia quinghaiensis TaxID=262806 RepID=UPI00042A0C3A|nr:type I-E CRISPR-associated protein Cas7/Cse4/CasC [Jonesia quinghaiensis]